MLVGSLEIKKRWHNVLKEYLFERDSRWMVEVSAKNRPEVVTTLRHEVTVI